MYGDPEPDPKPRYTFVRGDYWVGLYKDGKLLTQEHTLDYTSIIRLLDLNGEVVWADPKWLEDKGWLPDNLEGVVRE